MNTLYAKKKVMRMRLESLSISGSMETGQPAVLPVEEVIPHFLFLLLFVFINSRLRVILVFSLSYPDIFLKEVKFCNLHLVGNQVM